MDTHKSNKKIRNTCEKHSEKRLLWRSERAGASLQCWSYCPSCSLDLRRGQFPRLLWKVANTQPAQIWDERTFLLEKKFIIKVQLRRLKPYSSTEIAETPSAAMIALSTTGVALGDVRKRILQAYKKIVSRKKSEKTVLLHSQSPSTVLYECETNKSHGYGTKSRGSASLPFNTLLISFVDSVQ